MELLTESYLALQDRFDELRSQLADERSRRLHDLGHIHALDVAVAESRARAAELDARNTRLERELAEVSAHLGSTLTQLEHLHQAHAAATWSPHVLQLRTQWRRLPSWIRRPVHQLLDRVGRARDRRR